MAAVGIDGQILRAESFRGIRKPISDLQQDIPPILKCGTCDQGQTGERLPSQSERGILREYGRTRVARLGCNDSAVSVVLAGFPCASCAARSLYSSGRPALTFFPTESLRLSEEFFAGNSNASGCFPPPRPASRLISVKHKGKAKAAFRRMTFRALGIYWVLGLLLLIVSHFLLPGILVPGVIALTGLLIGFTLFAGYFFRDPDAQVPAGDGLIVAPGHGTVDVIDETEELLVMGGRCRRVSIFLSVFNVHVQQAPVAGTVIRVVHTPGQFLNAMKLESAALNENVIIGFQTSEPACGPVAIKLITGLIARRIIPWVEEGDAVAKGERISLIQFGSRVDIYLPLQAKVAVALGDRVVGGETVVARLQG